MLTICKFYSFIITSI